MDVNGLSSAAGVSPLGVAPARPNSASHPNQMAIGDQLNAMSGVNTEKNLYAEKKSMDKDAFLKMFMEQLKYQDPMNPQKSDQFTAQMAQFSQLEQSLQTNKHLEKMVSQQNNMQVAALQLVGKNVTADRSGLYHDRGKITSMTFAIPNDLSDIKVEIVDPQGEVAKTYKIGDRNAGNVNWKWDGIRENGVPADTGKYTYRVKGMGLDGKESKINSKVDGRVSGVTSSNGVVYLLIGEQKVALNDVETIKDPNAVKGTGADASKLRSAVFKPAGQVDSTQVGQGENSESALASGENSPIAPEGSISGFSQDDSQSQNLDVASNGAAGTNGESINNNGQTADSRDEKLSQNWDRLNPLMPLNLR